MASQPLICHECGTLLYLPCPLTTPVNVDNAVRLTAAQKIIAGIACTSETCPSQTSLQETFGIMEDIQVDQPLEQPGDLHTVSPQDVMGGQPPEEQQQHDGLEQLQFLQQLEQLELVQQGHEQGPEEEEFPGDFPQEVDGKPVHQGVNPCRLCYQNGKNCHRPADGSDTCRKCSKRQKLCNKSLSGAIPKGRWENVAVIDYTDPVTIEASRVRDGPDGGDVLEYLTKWVFKRHKASWEAAENLKDYPWILKKFHHENPQMPGPADWLVEYDDDEFFYGG